VDFRASKPLVAAFSLSALLWSSAASATPILDQSFVVEKFGSVFPTPFVRVLQVPFGQVFTVGISGILTHVKAQAGISPFSAGESPEPLTEPLDYAITTVSQGLPGTVLASGSVSHLNLPDARSGPLHTFDFEDITVSAGDVLALIMSKSGSTGKDYAWATNVVTCGDGACPPTIGDYAGGTAALPCVPGPLDLSRDLRWIGARNRLELLPPARRSSRPDTDFPSDPS
jgi:hypothetical protein